MTSPAELEAFFAGLTCGLLTMVAIILFLMGTMKGDDE